VIDTYVRISPGGVHRDTAPLDQRLMLRMPRVAAALRRIVLGLPPRSRLRASFFKRATQLAFSAYERGEFGVAAELFYSPSIEMRGGDLGDIGPDMAYDVTGREGIRHWVERWQEPFAWIKYDVPELLDFGHAMVFTLHQVAEGRASGAPTELETYSAMRLDGGFVSWQGWYRERDDALRAVGVEPASVPPPDVT
jgi:hypothetical protein